MAGPRKRPGNPSGRPPPKGRRPNTLELRYGEDQEPLRVDDPRPQRVTQLPTSKLAASLKENRGIAQEVIPTTVFDRDSSDEELHASYDLNEVSEPGFDQAYLYVERGPGAGQLVPIRQGPLVIGRASISDLRLAHPSVSRRHAQLTRVGERYYLKDFGSQNGTLVNQVRIASEMESRLGDQITIGAASLKLRGPPQPGLERIVQLKPNARTPAKPSVRGSDAMEAAGDEVDLEAAEPAAKSLPHRRTNSLMRVGVYGVLLGFGLAGVFAFAMIRQLRGPSFTELTPEAARAQTRLDAPLAPAPAQASASPMPLTAPPPTEQQPAVPAQAQAPAQVQEGQAPSEALAAAPAAPAELGSSSAPPPRARTARAEKLSRQRTFKGRTAGFGRETADDAPAFTQERDVRQAEFGGSVDPNILTRYEEGDIEGALELARNTDALAIVAKLTRFQSTYKKAKSALDVNDGVAAIQNFSAALKLDEQLSSGWSEFGVEIRTQLGRLYNLAGSQHLKGGNARDAKKAYEIALKYDPENKKAKDGLTQAKDQIAESAEEIWSEETGGDDGESAVMKPRVKSASIKKARRARLQAIDEAWGD